MSPEQSTYVSTLIDTRDDRVMEVAITAPSAGAALGVLWTNYPYPQYVRMAGFGAVR